MHHPIPKPALTKPSDDCTCAEDPAIRRAIFALLVAHCHDAPPADTPNVQAEKRNKRSDSIGQVGDWLLEHVVLAHAQEKIVVSDLIDELLQEFGEDKDGKVEGMDTNAVTALLRKLARALGRRSPRIAGGQRTKNIYGARLVFSAESRSVCIDCGKETDKAKEDVTNVESQNFAEWGLEFDADTRERQGRTDGKIREY